MWKLGKPDVTNVGEHLDVALNGAADDDHAFVLSGTDRTAILQLYRTYDEVLGRPEEQLLGNGISEACKNAVHAAYRHVREAGRLSALRAALKLGASECPYCGFGQIQDIDHHLAKAVFKLLSIYAVNLIPCCATCNRYKPKLPSKGPEEHLINVYLEELPDTDFFVAETMVDPGMGALYVTFKPVETAGMSGELYARLQHHMEVFRLNDRYRAQVNIYLSSHQVAFENMFDSQGEQGVRSYLQQNVDKSPFGRNDWRTALMRGLSENDEFCSGGFRRAIGKPITGV